MSGSAPWAPISSVSTTELVEVQRPGAIPAWEIPGWLDRFGVTAGITGRADPDGTPFDLGLWGRRPVAEAMGTWRRFRQDFPGFDSLVLAHQVHGAVVRWQEQRGVGWLLQEGADGHLTSQRGLLLLVTVADCIPVYLVAPRQGVIGLLHAGWRGTADGILTRAVELLRAQEIPPRDLVMHAGVGIAGRSYQVGQEVMAGVGRPAPGPGPWQLDLRSVLAHQAEALGIGEVSCSPHDTADRTHFHSHRASGGTDGRMVAWIGLTG